MAVFAAKLLLAPDATLIDRPVVLAEPTAATSLPDVVAAMIGRRLEAAARCADRPLPTEPLRQRQIAFGIRDALLQVGIRPADRFEVGAFIVECVKFLLCSCTAFVLFRELRCHGL